MHGRKEEETRDKTKKLSERKRQEMSVSNGTKPKHVIRVHDTIHSADNNTAGQQTLTNYPTQRKNEQSH